MLVLCHLQLPMDENPNQTGLIKQNKTRQVGLSRQGPWEALRLQHGRQRLSSAQCICFLSVRTRSRGPEKCPEMSPLPVQGTMPLVTTDAPRWVFASPKSHAGLQ